MMRNWSTYLKGDALIWLVVFFLSIVSLLAVYSAAGSLAYQNNGGTAEAYLFDRFKFIVLGLVAMYFAHKVPFRVYGLVGTLGIIVVVPLLLLTLFMGSNINDASRWLRIPGLPFSIQTSDLAKLFLVLYMAKRLATAQPMLHDFVKGFLPLALPLVLVVVLVLPANFSTAALLFLIGLIMMFIGGVPYKYLFGLVGSGIVGLLLLILLATAMPRLLPRLSTWKARIENFTSDAPKDAYQIEQAKMSISMGGILGQGPGNNAGKYRLPQSYSDFIFAMIIGEYGLLGTVFLPLAFVFLLYRCLKVGSRSQSAFGTFAAYGIGLSISIQAFINMAVAVNLFPVTGQPLPWVSMGGTSTLITGLTLGIVLSISRGEANSTESTNTVQEGQLSHA
jgi:cell division protein FtsW